MRRIATTSGRRQRARIVSLPSPVGGWNARDSIAQMKKEDAVSLDNFFCTPFDVQVRQGYSTQSTGYASQVNTIHAYEQPSGTNLLFSASGTNIYDITTGGAIGTPVIQGTSNSTFQKLNFGTGGGLFAVLVNGADLPIIYNGTYWTNTFAAAFNTTISTLTSVGTTATATMSVGHNLKTGMSITIAGVTPAAYNGTYVVTVTGSTTFTYTIATPAGVVTVMGTATPPLNLTITGVDPTTFIHTAIFKSRLWFVEKNSMRAWYLPTLSVGGAANSVDLSPLFTQGGYLMAMGDWSLDAGYGLDDYMAFVSSNGQVAIYKGTDPASPTTWSLIGVYDIGSPIGRRCLLKYAGDLLIVCQDGLQSLSKALMSTRVNNANSLTDKIQHVVSQYISLYGSNFGWEIAAFPKQNMLLLNIPVSTTASYQVVMNTISGAWSRFINWDAHTFELFNDNLYFGGSTYVAKAWDTYADNGANISFNAQQSFNYMGGSGQLKQVSMVRPIIATDGSPALLLGVNADFDTTVPTGVPSFSPATGGSWDNGLWDVAVWGGEATIKKDWQTAFALGYCFAAHFVGTSLGCQMRWSATDFALLDGGMI